MDRNKPDDAPKSSNECLHGTTPYGTFLADQEELAAKLALIDSTVERLDPARASQPTHFMPGTVEKVVILRQRLEQGLPLFLPEDGAGSLQ